jgi:hypothetical protein
VNQTEVYKITHNLSLTNPHKQLHVVITTKEWGVQAQVFQEANHFIVTTMKEPPLVAKETEFDFIAVHYSKKP